MKLLRESPVEFLEPLSKPPEKVYVTGVDCGRFRVYLAGTSRGLVHVSMEGTLRSLEKKIRMEWNAEVVEDSAPFEIVSEDLRAYFSGVPGPIRGIVQPVRTTPFTLEVHRLLARIPFGKTLQYGEIAELMGKPGAARAVGNACGRNPVMLVVPCHRVVATSGLGGFGGGLDMKKMLLRLESV